MTIVFKKNNRHERHAVGCGFLNNLINKLPIELHLPGYQFCGPGTKLEKRLAKGQKGINALDAACREHDIAYETHNDTENRKAADKILAERAWERVKAKDSSFGEKANAWLVTNAMKAKAGSGFRKARKNIKSKKSPKKKCCTKIFTSAVKEATKILKMEKPSSIEDALKIAENSLSSTLKSKNPKIIPRVIPIPKVGGFLPLIPILAAIAKLGGIISGGLSVAKLIKNVITTKDKKPTEPVAVGNGLYLKPYRKGYGFYLKPYPKN